MYAQNQEGCQTVPGTMHAQDTVAMPRRKLFNLVEGFQAVFMTKFFNGRGMVKHLSQIQV